MYTDTVKIISLLPLNFFFSVFFVVFGLVCFPRFLALVSSQGFPNLPSLWFRSVISALTSSLPNRQDHLTPMPGGQSGP